MSTISRELSLDDGRPIRLYEFSRGPLRWYYCTADRDITISNLVFKGMAISDSGIQFSGQATSDPITITMPADTEVSVMFRAVAPSDRIDVVIRDTHYGELDFVVVYVGSILSVKWPNELTAEVSIWALSASLDRPGLTMSWQRGCPLTLYGRGCNVDEQAFRVDGSVELASGLTIRIGNAGNYPAGYFSGGYLEWQISPGVLERRGIRQHAGTDLILLAGVFGLANGTIASMYPGCNRTFNTCSLKFNNQANYGGFPWLPGRSPFDGNPVF